MVQAHVDNPDLGREWGGWGDVVDVGLRRTQVRKTDGGVACYPNSVLAMSVITNAPHVARAGSRRTSPTGP